MPKSAQEIANKQVRRAQEASADYVSGVESVTESPGARAVKKKDKLRNNVIAAIDSGKWEANTAAVSLEEWKSKTKSKGGERYARGVEESREAIIAFHEEFQPFVQRVKAELDQMPDATKEQRKAKMVANFDKMSQFKRSRRRR